MFSKIKTKYILLDTPVKATIWFTICSFTQKGISMITTPIFTRLLTTSQYGVYSIYQSWYSILSIILTLSVVSGVFNNAMIKFEENRDEYISSVQGLTTISTFVFLFIYLCGKDFWNEFFGLPTFMILLIFVQCLLEMPFSLWSARQRFEFKYTYLVIFTIVIGFFSPLLGVIMVNTTLYKAEARVISLVLVQGLVGVLFYAYNIFKGRKLFDNRYWKYTLSLALPLIPHYLSMTLLQQSDRIMISQLIGNDKAAIYSVAYSISTLIMLLLNSINASFVPYTYQKMKKKEYKVIRNNSNFLLVLIGFFCILVMALGPEVIMVFATKEYFEAIWIMPPVTASVFFRFLYSFYCNVEFYYEKKWYVTSASVIGSILNIILNYIFVSRYGFIAAGYTTLFCYMLFSIFHYIFYKRIIKKEGIEIEQIYDEKIHFAISLILLICMIGITFLYKYTIVRYGIVVFLCFLLYMFKNKIIVRIKEIRK